MRLSFLHENEIGPYGGDGRDKPTILPLKTDPELSNFSLGNSIVKKPRQRLFLGDLKGNLEPTIPDGDGPVEHNPSQKKIGTDHYGF